MQLEYICVCEIWNIEDDQKYFQCDCEYFPVNFGKLPLFLFYVVLFLISVNLFVQVRRDIIIKWVSKREKGRGVCFFFIPLSCTMKD